MPRCSEIVRSYFVKLLNSFIYYYMILFSYILIVYIMEQDKQQEEFVNCKTDKKTENSTKREPNPKPVQKISDGVKRK